MKSNLLILFFFIFTFVFPQQTFIYKAVPAAMKAKIAVTDVERNKIKNQYFSTAEDLTAYLPSNYDKSGSTDYTLFLQKGLTEHSMVIMPDFPVLIAPRGLQLKSDSKILFQKKSQLIVKKK